MLYTTTMFLTNLILAIASIIPIVLHDNRGEVKIPRHVVKALASVFLPDILELASTTDGMAMLEAWSRDYQAQKAAEAERQSQAKTTKQTAD
ncbi:MAG: hypothetical protein KBS45_02900 [Clostridiales bacterium]|nr:hypothetical protein [Candidatus Coliplasma caballi]